MTSSVHAPSSTQHTHECRTFHVQLTLKHIYGETLAQLHAAGNKAGSTEPRYFALQYKRGHKRKNSGSTPACSIAAVGNGAAPATVTWRHTVEFTCTAARNKLTDEIESKTLWLGLVSVGDDTEKARYDGDVAGSQPGASIGLTEFQLAQPLLGEIMIDMGRYFEHKALSKEYWFPLPVNGNPCKLHVVVQTQMDEAAASLAIHHAGSGALSADQTTIASEDDDGDDGSSIFSSSPYMSHSDGEGTAYTSARSFRANSMRSGGGAAPTQPVSGRERVLVDQYKKERDAERTRRLQLEADLAEAKRDGTTQRGVEASNGSATGGGSFIDKQLLEFREQNQKLREDQKYFRDTISRERNDKERLRLEFARRAEEIEEQNDELRRQFERTQKLLAQEKMKSRPPTRSAEMCQGCSVM